MVKPIYLISALTIICFLGIFNGSLQSISNATTNQRTFIKDVTAVFVIEDTMDRYFYDYSASSQLYLNRQCFSGTPLTGELLAHCAKNSYNKTGIIVPLEFALSQAQWESSMGTKGLSHKTNPYNVGEFDRGTMITFKTTKDGVQAYYDLLTMKYLSNLGDEDRDTTIFKSTNDLLTKFIDMNGYRYASSKSYERQISNQSDYIKQWVTINSDTTSAS